MFQLFRHPVSQILEDFWKRRQVPWRFHNCIVIKVYNRICFLTVDTYTYMLILSAYMWSMCPGFPNNQWRIKMVVQKGPVSPAVPCRIFCFASSCCFSRVQVLYKFLYYLPSSRGCFGHPLPPYTLLDVRMWTTSLNACSINLIDAVWKVFK